MIQQAWNSLLDFISQFVIPDWGGLIALLPVFIGIVVILFFARMIYVYATIGPSRVRAARRKPVAPGGRPHAGPDLLARSSRRSATFLLFAGIVFGGCLARRRARRARPVAARLGPRGLKDYDYVAETPPQQVDKTFIGPPPGVHVPGPTFRPLLVALGVGLAVRGDRVRRLAAAHRASSSRSGRCSAGSTTRARSTATSSRPTRPATSRTSRRRRGPSGCCGRWRSSSSSRWSSTRAGSRRDRRAVAARPAGHRRRPGRHPADRPDRRASPAGSRSSPRA